MTPSSARERRLAYFAWALVCVIWGTTYLGIRISLETIPPALMGGLRWTIAGVLLGGYVLMRGEPLPSRKSWGGIALMAFLLLGLGNGGVVVAEQWVPSGLTAVFIATSPFWMAGVEACLRDGERLTRATALGLAVGFARNPGARLARALTRQHRQPTVSDRCPGAADRVAWLVAGFGLFATTTAER